ncbi:MAG TPA: hypothetical protein VF997_13085 [Polyangia bacterium]
MRRVAFALLVVVACGCRRTHVAPSYESDAPAATAPTPAPPARATTGVTPDNPLGEPALPPRDDRARMPDGGTLNGDPRGPRPAEWQAIVDGAMPALQACFDRAGLPPGEIAVSMRYTVELPGYTGAVTAAGPAAPKPALDCCVKVIEGLKFPEYRGEKVERELAFSWFKREAAGRDGGAAKKP